MSPFRLLFSSFFLFPQVETPDKNYQYLLFACEPYETVAFKLPSHQIDKSEGKFATNWDALAKKFVLTMYFLDST